jgi:YVTN family beta-propeller protein
MSGYYAPTFMDKTVTTAVIALVLGIALVAQQPARPPRPGVKTAGVKIPIERLKPEAIYQVGGHPDWLAIDEAAWVSNEPSDNVSRLDPKSSTATTIALGAGKHPCSGLATGFGSLWIPNCGDQTLARIDLKTNAVTATVPMTIGDSEGGIATGAGSVWLMLDKKGTLARIDPATNKVVAEITVPTGSFGIAFGPPDDAAVWVTSSEHHSVTRVDPHTNLVVETIAVGKSPRFIAVGAGGVWTINQTDGTVSRIDPKTNKVAATIDVGIPGGGGEIAVGEGSVWVTSFEFPLSRIDPVTNTVVQQFYGPGGDAVRVGLGFVWLSNLRQGNVWRLDPKRIEATLPD